MIRISKKTLAAWLFTSLLAACGGGGSGGSDSNGDSGPPASGIPTITLTPSQQTANDLAADAVDGARSLFKTTAAQGLPIGVLISAPTGTTQTSNESCTISGSAKWTVSAKNLNGNPVAGDSITIVLTNCVDVVGLVQNGTIKVVFTRFTDENNFAFTVQLVNFSYTENGVSYGPYSYLSTWDLTNGVFSYAFSVDGNTVVGLPVVQTSGNQVTIQSGDVHQNFGSGWLDWHYDNFVYDSVTGRPVSGSVTVVGSGGTSAVLTATATGYTVLIAANNSSQTYNVVY